MKYIFLCLILMSCGQKDKYREDYGLLASTQLTVSSKHMGGYGRTQCLLCHNASLNIHRRIGAAYPGDTAAQVAKINGVETCLSCHGTNGLPQ
jgi:hypothetical protein